MLKLPKRHHNSGKEYASVQYSVLLHIALRNLLNRKLRSLLTVAGVVIGIGAIFFLLSFGMGINQLVTKEVVGDESIKTINVSSPNSKIIKLTEQSLNEIKSYTNVTQAGGEYSFPGSVSYGGGEVDAVVYGIDEPYQNLVNLNLEKGRLLNNQDFNGVLVNRSALESFGITESAEALDKKLTIKVPFQNQTTKTKDITDEFTIVGVIDSGNGSEVFMLGERFGMAGVESFKNIKVGVNDAENVGDLRRLMESSGFETTSPVDTLEQINQVFRVFTIALVSFGAIGMIVSVLGMFNTMTISLLERTREIGLMMALGGRNSDMRRLFIIEAVIISVVGAIVGIVLAIISGQFINAIINQIAVGRGVTERFQLFSTPLWAILLMIWFMVIVGVVVVYFPARRASRINPIDALRRE